MSELVSIASGLYGYGAQTPEQLLRYLTRSVNGVSFAAPEELYAARLLLDMQNQIRALEQELVALARRQVESRTDEDADLKRIAFCVQQGVMQSGEMLYAGLDCEPVVNGDYRTALDKLMT